MVMEKRMGSKKGRGVEERIGNGERGGGERRRRGGDGTAASPENCNAVTMGLRGNKTGECVLAPNGGVAHRAPLSTKCASELVSEIEVARRKMGKTLENGAVCNMALATVATAVIVVHILLNIGSGFFISIGSVLLMILGARIILRNLERRVETPCPALKGWERHHEDVSSVKAAFLHFLKCRGPGQKVSMQRSSSGKNLSNRTSEPIYKESASALDVSRLNQVIAVDRGRMLIHVEPGIAMDQLAHVAMAHGIVPQVVLEFPGITVGGTVCGGGIESSSHKYGSFIDTVEEMDVLTGDGVLHTRVTRETNPDLFHAVSTSYGTMGVLTRLAIRVEETSPYVHVKYTHVNGIKSATAAMECIANGKNAPEFIDGVGLSARSAMVVVGSMVKSPPPQVKFRSLRSRRWDPWFFWHISSLARQMETVDFDDCGGEGIIASAHEEYMILEDFLFRFDRGAFWMARHGLQLFYGRGAFDPTGPVAGPHILLRMKYAWLCTTRQLYRMLHRCGDDLVARTYIVQDFIMPSSKEACSLVDFSEEHTRIWPVWICPVRVIQSLHSTNAGFGFPLQAAKVGGLMFNVGIYGTPVDAKPFDPWLLNRSLEGFVTANEGRKMLYAQNFYTKEEFWQLFDDEAYRRSRRLFSANGIFPDVDDKLLLGSRLEGLKGIKSVSFKLCWWDMLNWYLSLWKEMVVPRAWHEQLGLDNTEMLLYAPVVVENAN